MKNTNTENKKLTEKELLNKRKMSLYITLSFITALALAGGNMYLGSKFSKTNKNEKFKIAQNFSFVSAKATSDLKKEVSKRTVSYLVDVDLNDDGKTDKTLALVNKVKYVSNNRLKKLSKIENGSRLVFECNVKSHMNVYENKENEKPRFPEIVVDEISGSSAVGLIDHLIAVDGEKINDAREENNKTYIDYLDSYKKENGKWQDGAFDFLYTQNIRGTR